MTTTPTTQPDPELLAELRVDLARAVRLADGGSVTARQELAGLREAIADLEAAQATVPDRLGNDIIRISSSEWLVRSRRHAPGAYWRVQVAQGDEPVCGCPAGRDLLAGEVGRYSTACHHLRVAVDFEVKRDRLAHPRPTPPAAPASMFVD